jgi:activator of HSP90 ATPase
MRSIITDSVVLPASAEKLFEMFLDPDEHAAFTGKPVTIGAEQGAAFEAFDGMLTGKMLHVVGSRLIVQSWRSCKFHEEDPDSTLMLTFTSEDNLGRIDLVHLDVPAHDYDDVVAGWKKHYWQPWREYLRQS